MKRSLLVLFLIFILACAVSCSGAGTADTTEEQIPTDSPDTPTALDLADEASDIKYEIIYESGDKYISAANDLKGELMSFTKVRIFPKADNDGEATEHEILIGNTNRDESKAVYDSLGEDEYAVKLVGSKLVIVGKTAKATKIAIGDFMAQYVTKDNTKCTVPANLEIKGTVKSEYDGLDAGWTFLKYESKDNTELPYQLYLPANMDKSKEYPVLLFMHGLGSVGTKGEHTSQAVAQIVKNIASSQKYKNEVIIIAPQHPKGEKWVNVDYKPGTYDFDKTPISKYLKAAKELFDYAFDELPIDTDRVYGYGNSMGAFATVYLAMTYPELYAAIVPVAGGYDASKASLIKDIPSWFFHGDADTTVNIKGANNLVKNLQDLGSTNVKYTVYKGVGHATQGCFVAAANTPELLDWMFSQSK